MRLAWRRLGIFFGLVDDKPARGDRHGRMPGDAGYELRPLGPVLVRRSAAAGVLALISAIVVVHPLRLDGVRMPGRSGRRRRHGPS